MKSIKHIMTLFLSLVMILSLIVSSGVITASAVAGAGLQQTSFRSHGVDISFWNVYHYSGDYNEYSWIDFEKMKADGCEYVILRLGYEASASRKNTLDTAFLEYYKRGRAAGMPMGVYFYGLSTTKEGAIEDAQWVIDVIESNNMYFEYPIYYDVEDSAQVALGASAMESLCLGWCETLEAAGYFPGIYGGGWSVIDKLSDDFKSKYDLWYAWYKSTDPNNQFNYNSHDNSAYCGMWQYASCGYTYDGVHGENIDMNVCYKDYPAIMKQYGYNNCGESEAKSALRAAVDKADSLRYYPYNNAQITAIRNAYNSAVSVLNNTASTDTACTNAAKALNDAIDYTSGILSIGKSYTVSANPRTDEWKDDGKRLTDGSRLNLPGDTEAYSGLGTNAMEIVVDLGANAGDHNNYGVFAGANAGWGISAPFEVVVSVSKDGTNYTELATTTTANAVSQNGDWATYYLNARAPYNVSERYVKFSITPNSGDHIWLDEVVVANSDAAVKNAVYINGINEKITAGDCHVFTPAFGEISVTSGNIAYTFNVVVKWDGATSSYIVKSITGGNGTSTPAITLAADELLIAVHGWEGESYEDSVYGSAYNYDLISAVQVGDKIYFNGVDVAKGTIAPAAYVSVPERNVDDSDDNFGAINDNLAVGKTYQTTGIYSDGTNILYPDENGKTLTDGKNAPADAKYSNSAFVGFNKNSEDYDAVGYASITVDLGDVYAVDKFVAHVASSYNSSVGIYAPASVSVYVSTDNETWVEAGSVVPTDDASVSTIAATVSLDKSVEARYVQFRIVAGKSWLFVTEVEVYEGEPVEEPKPDYLVGDVNDDKTVDSIDYLLVKRACFNTYELSEDETMRADVNVDDVIDSTDYLLVKRIAFGTYKVA